jgi:hypothetical protein
VRNRQTIRRAESMQNRYLALIVVVVLAWPSDSFAHRVDVRLPGSQPSFIIPTRDGKRIVVMLSALPSSEDEGNACTLPNGKTVRLRDTFQCSGLYEVGSTTPIWTVKWFGDKGCVFASEEGRYVVRVNRFLGGPAGCCDDLYWGIKFYDAGAEVKSYDVSELVDYPSLLGYDLRWVDWKSSGNEIRDGMYYLSTCCRERYTFDVATGRIVEESRCWRRVVHWTYAVLSIIAVLGVWLVRRIHKAVPKTATSEVEPVPFDGEGRPIQYSLRSLMLFVTLGAVVCSVFSIGAHVGVFVSSVALAVFLTDVLWRKQRRRRLQGGIYSSKGGRKPLWTGVLASWFVVYVLSMGPVAAVMSPQCLDCRRDTRIVILHRVYAPASWVGGALGYYCRPVRLYFSAFDPATFPSEIELIM